jgi:RNA polymerase sigma factor (sigma-70 family)
MAIETPGTRAAASAARPAVRPGSGVAAARATAMGKLFDDRLPVIYAFVAIRVPDRTAAEDVTARIFERAGSVADEVSPAEGLGAFLQRVAASAVLDHARRSRNPLPGDRRASDFDRPGDRAAAAEIVDALAARAFAAAIDRIALRRATGRVADAQLHVLLLRYLDGLTPAELGAALACTEAEAAAEVDVALRGLFAVLEPAPGRVQTGIEELLPVLDVELQAAGAQARLALRGVTQPTRWFAQQLRARFVAATPGSSPPR